MTRALSSQQLTDLVTVMNAALIGIAHAKAVEPSGKTVLRQLPDPMWQDPVWQHYIEDAFGRLVLGLTADPGLLSLRVFDMPAATFYATSSQIAGALDGYGALRGDILGRDPILVRWAAGEVGPGRPGVSRGVFIAIVMAAGIGGFAVARGIRRMRG